MIEEEIFGDRRLERDGRLGRDPAAGENRAAGTKTRRLGKQGDGAGLCGWLKRKLNVKLDRAAVEN